MHSDHKFWTKAARKYAASPISDVPAYEYTLGRTKSYLKVTDRVLELGCGTGSTAILLAPSVAHIEATDFSEGMIEIAQERQRDANVNNMTARVADPKEAKKGGPFDAVLALNFLHLIEDIDVVLAQVADAVKPGGYFISKTVCTPTERLPFKIRLMFWALPIAQWLGKAPFVRFDDAVVLDERIMSMGFEIVETDTSANPPPNRYIVARKPL